MFRVGDKIRCIESRGFRTNGHLVGLAFRKKVEVTRVENWNDGSQSIWIKAPSKKQELHNIEFGPYVGSRFEFLHKQFEELPYDPTQQGDCEDDI